VLANILIDKRMVSPEEAFTLSDVCTCETDLAAELCRREGIAEGLSRQAAALPATPPVRQPATR
jgi:hypothetical protein